MTHLWTVVKIAATAYAGLCLLVFLRQSAYVYYPDRNVELTPAYHGVRFESLRLRTEDGETLAAWYVPAAIGEASAPVVLYCHGNGGDLGDIIDAVKGLHDMDLNVLAFDYRGYGESSGRPSEAGTYKDARAAWRYLSVDRGVDPRRIIVFGRSLGGSVAAWLAQAETPGALVVESAFTSAPDMARRMFWYLPVGLLCRFRYDTLTFVKRAKCPVLIAHSKDDEMVPYEHGRRLFEAAPEPKQLVALAGGHNDGGLEIDAAVQPALLAFIKRHVGETRR